MASKIPWKKTLAAKLGFITLLLFVLVLALILVNFLMLASLRSDMNWINQAGKGRGELRVDGPETEQHQRHGKAEDDFGRFHISAGAGDGNEDKECADACQDEQESDQKMGKGGFTWHSGQGLR